MDLPAGLPTRALTTDDLEAVFEIVAAEEAQDVGEVLIERADIVADWQRPSFDLGASSVGVLDDGRLVAFAELSHADRAEVGVHPSHRGRGVGRWLSGWIQDTARARGIGVVGSTVFAGSPADRLLERLGYRVRWTSWVLRLPEGRSITPQPLPPGYAVRQARPDEHRRVWSVVEDAFGEWADRDRQSFEDFEAGVFRRPGYAPWQLRVAADPVGDVVGVAFVIVAGTDAFVEKLAVNRGHRNLGLARALLVDAFAVGREHGGTRAELNTDSRTGALSLYEKIGMEVSGTWLNRAIDL